MTSRSSPCGKNAWSKLPEKQSGLPRSLRSLARTGGYYCFKKNDVLGQADPSASRKTTFWDKRTPPLPYYKAETSKFIAFLFAYWMKRWLQLQKSRQLHWQNSIMQNMESLWTFLLQIFCIKKAAEHCFARNRSEGEFKHPRSLSHNGSRYKHIFWQDQTRSRVPSEWSVASLMLYNVVSPLTRRQKRQRFSW